MEGERPFDGGYGTYHHNSTGTELGGARDPFEDPAENEYGRSSRAGETVDPYDAIKKVSEGRLALSLSSLKLIGGILFLAVHGARKWEETRLLIAVEGKNRHYYRTLAVQTFCILSRNLQLFVFRFYFSMFARDTGSSAVALSA